MREPNVYELLMLFPSKVKRYASLLAERHISDDRIKPQHLTFIPYIAEFDGISQKDLNVFLQFDKSYVSTVVRELIDMGLVYNDGAGKTYSLHLTEEGRKVNDVCEKIIRASCEGLLDGFTEEDLQQFTETFTRFSNKLDALVTELEKEDSDSENDS